MYHGKVIYNPSGKAGEYSYWAANFYNGCSAKCEYCYNRHGRGAKILGGDTPILKKSLQNEETAFKIFCKEVKENITELQKHGLFFNFVSDPCLHETIQLNGLAIGACIALEIPVKMLTKQTWWIDNFLDKNTDSHSRKYLSIGFTLTGCDDQEPGAATNRERIEAGYKLKRAGFKMWFSIEPIINFPASLKMIRHTSLFCDLYKIGLQSGKKYNQQTIRDFIDDACRYIGKETPIYFKDSILKQAGISRDQLSENCVTRDFNL